MFVSRGIHANHTDLIHDVAYDFYGLRMATCSSDQMIKIWDLRPDGEWVCTARWRCHLGPCWRVTWAHPEFGQVIATCSFDRTITIWEEIAGGQSNPGTTVHDPDNPPVVSIQSNTACYPAAQPTSTSWVRRANLVDPRTSVTGLQFAPRHLGLQLAAISTDGLLRVYEALDVMNLSQWRLQFDFPTKLIGSCLAWSQSPFDPPLIAVGSAAPASSASSNDAADQSGTSALQPHFGLGTTVSSSNSLITGKVVIYEYSEARRHWDLVEDIREMEDAVYDIQFAPHMGQSFHTLAVGSKDVFILRIRSMGNQPTNISSKGNLNLSGSGSFTNSAPPTRTAYEINLLARFNHHKGRVWRVSWNVTGSILASSGDDGCIRLWQANYLGAWQPISVIAPDGSQPTGVLDPGPSLTIGSMMPPLPPPVRSLGTRLQIKLPGPPSAEQNRPLDRVGSGVNVPFQKSGTFTDGSCPVAWH
ncbi:Nucleoporin SEH1 [Clonorchis sinensis]|uniref:Nucleoporin SEH1 n=1 Tax=Clonorchis sinensis TaxID=79923 RepID=A0A8T1MAB9_CLOSI|nr:Nucleoporin SEH1 [Clonorchis sinensis]